QNQARILEREPHHVGLLTSDVLGRRSLHGMPSGTARQRDNDESDGGDTRNGRVAGVHGASPVRPVPIAYARFQYLSVMFCWPRDELQSPNRLQDHEIIFDS